MTPTKVTGANVNMKAPAGQEDSVQDIWANRETIQGMPAITTAFLPSQDELEDMVAGQPVLLSIIGHTMSPAMLTVEPPICPLCDHPVRAGQDHGNGGPDNVKMHTSCLELRLAGMSDAERDALNVRALASEVGAFLKDDPEHVEIRPDVFARREDIANCFNHLEDARLTIGDLSRAVRALNAQLIAAGCHNEMTRAVARAALAKMTDEPNPPA